MVKIFVVKIFRIANVRFENPFRVLVYEKSRRIRLQFSSPSTATLDTSRRRKLVGNSSPIVPTFTHVVVDEDPRTMSTGKRWDFKLESTYSSPAQVQALSLPDASSSSGKRDGSGSDTEVAARGSKKGALANKRDVLYLAEPLGYKCDDTPVTAQGTVKKAIGVDKSLLDRKAWEAVMQPLQSVFMNVFMLWMMGSNPGIFGIMMISYTG